jgi:hypothetical protein
VVSAAPAVVTDDGVVVYTPATEAEILLYPPLGTHDSIDGLFGRYPVGGQAATPVPAQLRIVSSEGPAREPVIDPVSGNASAPTDHDFAAAAVYEIAVPPELLDRPDETLLRVDWTGDVGRVYIGDTLVADHFWYGPAWEIGLRRFRHLLRANPLRLHLLPLRKDAPVYLSPQMRPTGSDAGQVLKVRSATFVPLSRVPVEPASR